MNDKIIDLSREQAAYINEQLSIYDKAHIQYSLEDGVQIGIEINGMLVGGLNAYTSAYHILYVDTVFVEKEYRRRGLGRILMQEMEQRAKKLGINLIRLDTFDWQGYEFYISLGYEVVGHYYNEIDNFHEYFFVKRI